MKQETRTKIRKLVANLFKNSQGKPYILTDGQCEIFFNVINFKENWLWISAPTRYGKTEVVALALIYLAFAEHLKIPVVAGSQDKAEKIMEYVVAHLGDNTKLYQGLINVNIKDIDKLKVTMAKTALRWSDGGWIYVTSVDSRSLVKEGEGVVGEGGDVVLLEEAGLIKKAEQFSKIVRMPERNRGWGKLIMTGNCIENSVFETAYQDPMYRKVRIGLDQAIKEGRYTEEEIEEKKKQTTSKDWKRYYLVEFPKAGEFTYFKPKKYDLLPHELKYYGAFDPALGESLKGSLSGVVILGKDGAGQLYEVESFGEHITPEQAIRRIFNLQYKFERFVIEKVQFQSYFLNVINQKSKEEGLYIPFEGLSQQRKKEERIESLEPIINTGQILFRGEGELWNEMQEYPTSDKLDVLDTLEMAYRTASKRKVNYGFA